MIVEAKLAAFVSAALEEYKTHPLLVEQIFFDSSQSGQPIFTGPSTMVDREKLWLPGEYTGGILRWGGQEFPIVDNAAQQLTVEGDAESAQPDGLPYQIIPPAAAGLTALLQNEKFSVLTAFAQVPTSMPAITLRLEKDAQADTYLGESLEQYVSNGIEFDVRSHGMTGSYLFSLWAVNRDAVLWLYAWLHNALLRAIPMFTTWGLYDVALSGSDLDPALQYLAERTYTRHLLLTATRMERAVTLREAEWVHDVCIKVLAHYQTFNITVAARE